jgi:site-specific DNA-methyltransferase (adenine-specific)
VCGDNREVLKACAANKFDAVVTDPPYGLGFRGKEWDHSVPGVEFWREFFRVSKPGAHLVAFGGTRLWHRMVSAIEDAGWEIRDSLMWLYGTGFPKSLNVAKAADKVAGPSAPVAGDPVSRQWAGFGTALKPAWEPIVLARKPLDGTVVESVRKWSCGALNIDGCRIAGVKPKAGDFLPRDSATSYNLKGRRIGGITDEGRFPANLLLDEDAASALDEQTGDNVSRFFYCSKASKQDREAGLRDAEYDHSGPRGHTANGDGTERAPTRPRINTHPTVKPRDLMRYLVRLVCPPGGLVLDPFNGSGSTGVAVKLEGEGRRYVGIEMEPAYVEISRERIDGAE